MDSKVEPGDVIGVSRILYEHYGVYIGEGKVIHYHMKNSEIKLTVQETDIEEFLGGASTFFILDCEYRQPHKSAPIKYREAEEIFSKVKVFSPEDTIKRAKNKIGEGEYNLFLNNCEHFAIWCKTGIRQSHQIEELLWFIPRIKQSAKTALCL